MSTTDTNLEPSGATAEPLAEELAQLDGEREYGPQPLAEILTKHNLTNHQVVAASTEQLTHKMLSKACRGRFLSVKIRLKIQRAVNALTGGEYRLRDLFNY